MWVYKTAILVTLHLYQYSSVKTVEAGSQKKNLNTFQKQKGSFII